MATFTILLSSSGNLRKTFHADGKNNSPRPPSAGILRRTSVQSLAQLAELLENLPPNAAIIPGIIPGGPESAQLVLKAHENPPQSYARTKENFAFDPEDPLVVIDLDAKSAPAEKTLADYLHYFTNSILPPSTECLIRPSSRSFLSPEPWSAGAHIYLKFSPSAVALIPEFINKLSRDAIAKGFFYESHGRIQSFVDLTPSGRPYSIIFEAHPEFEPGVKEYPHDPIYIPGGLSFDPIPFLRLPEDQIAFSRNIKKNADKYPVERIPLEDFSITLDSGETLSGLDLLRDYMTGSAYHRQTAYSPAPYLGNRPNQAIIHSDFQGISVFTFKSGGILLHLQCRGATWRVMAQDVGLTSAESMSLFPAVVENTAVEYSEAFIGEAKLLSESMDEVIPKLLEERRFLYSDTSANFLYLAPDEITYTRTSEVPIRYFLEAAESLGHVLTRKEARNPEPIKSKFERRIREYILHRKLHYTLKNSDYISPKFIYPLDTYPGTVIDLRTGRTSTHSGAPFINRLGIDLPLPNYQKELDFLYQIGGETFRGQQDLIWLVAQAFVPHQKIIVYLEGPTNSGKTTFINLVAKMFGAYAVFTNSFILENRPMGRNPSAASPDIVGLKHARIAIQTEIPPGSKVYANTPLLKSVSGFDHISARGLYENQQVFIPRCLIVLVSNNFIKLNLEDEALVDRVRRIVTPFSFVPDPDPYEEFERERRELDLNPARLFSLVCELGIQSELYLDAREHLRYDTFEYAQSEAAKSDDSLELEFVRRVLATTTYDEYYTVKDFDFGLDISENRKTRLLKKSAYFSLPKPGTKIKYRDKMRKVRADRRIIIEDSNQTYYPFRRCKG